MASTNRSYEQVEYNYLISRGFTPAGAAGALGNFEQESNFSPTAYNAREGAIGIAQWENGRRTALDATAQAMNQPETSLDAQLAYLGKELSGPYSAVDQYEKSATSPTAAANVWNRQFEVSADYSPTRENNAQAIYNQVAAGQPLTGGNGTADSGAQMMMNNAAASSSSSGEPDNTLFDAIYQNAVQYSGFPYQNSATGASDPGSAGFQTGWSIPVTPYPGGPEIGWNNGKPTIGMGGTDSLNPLSALSNVAKVLAGFGTVFNRILWIFNVDHFMRFMLYVFGGIAVIAGLGMITFGSKVGAQGE